jgi:putative hydrolase of HD superfamily
MTRLDAQLRFLLEIDKLKSILRRTWLTDKSRFENSAEHSWHVALAAPLLAEYAAEPVDVAKVTRMLLLHDLVEIDANDTFCYDKTANLGKAQREQCAADRIFALLPDDQHAEFRQLWEEFEAAITPEARFANALDRLQPLLNNYHTQGAAWQQHKVRHHQVLDRNRPIEAIAPKLWQYVKDLLDDAVTKGYLAP